MNTMRQSVATETSLLPVPDEYTFRTRDGVQLFFRHWRGSGPNAVILIHRGHEHSGRMAHLVEELDMPEASFFAWDARAHGLSEGVQGPTTTMATFVQDLDEFVRHIGETYHIAEENIAIVAQSVGAVMVAAWAHDYAPRIRCMVLAAPAFQVKLYVPFARFFLGLWRQIVGDFYVKSYVKGGALTHDAARAKSYHADPLVKLQISARVLLDLYNISERVVADAGAIRIPTQILLSGADWVIHNGPPRQFFERLSTTDKELHTFDGFYHDTLGEKDRRLPIAKARDFLERQFAARPSLAHADQAGFTKSEYDALLKPLPAWSLKAISFAFTKLFLRTIGKLSTGIRIGCDTGFDSGKSLDYVYRNQPSGTTPLGKFIDWIYLNSPGWRGVRVRKQLIQELIGTAMGRLRATGRPVRIVDVAAGHGRYVLDAITQSGITPDSILLRDFDPRNVERGGALIAEKSSNATFEQGDAFDESGLATEDATIGIVSGLLELFPENDRPRATFGGLAAAIEPGGFLIYTGQPWHPQLEFIARTLSSHRAGAPWIMRRRTQEELDELARLQGFTKREQLIDPEGLFTVTLAQRIG